MNPIVYIADQKQIKNQNLLVHRLKKETPIFYRKDSLVQLSKNDTQRYVKGDEHAYNIKVDEYFASTRKFVMEKYGTIKKKESFGK